MGDADGSALLRFHAVMHPHRSITDPGPTRLADAFLRGIDSARCGPKLLAACDDCGKRSGSGGETSASPGSSPDGLDHTE